MPQHNGHSIHYEVNARNCNAIAQGFVPCRIRGTGNIRPVIRKALEALTLQRCQSSNQVRTLDHTLIFTHILVVDAMVIAVAYGSNRLLVRLHDQIRGIFMLSGTLCADHIVLFEDVSALSAVNSMAIHPCKSVCQISLIATPIAAVFRLPVNNIAYDTEGFVWLIHQWQVISTSTAPGRYGR